MDYKLLVCLKPFLIIDGSDFQAGIATGTKKYDDLIKDRISKDHTNIKGIFDYNGSDYRVIDYAFDGTYVYVVLTKKNGKRFSKDELDKIAKDIVDPYDTGPDTWMEGNIGILNREEAQGTKYYRDKDLESIELGVVVDGYIDEDAHEDPTKPKKHKKDSGLVIRMPWELCDHKLCPDDPAYKKLTVNHQK